MPNKKSKNPLFVVTNKGKDVEEAQGLFDAWIKRLGLTEAVETLKQILQTLLAQVQSYAMFLAVKELLDKLVATLETFSKATFPEFYFYRK